MAEDDEMINMKKADEDIDQIDAPESSNVEEESTRLKKQKIKEIPVVGVFQNPIKA